MWHIYLEDKTDHLMYEVFLCYCMSEQSKEHTFFFYNAVFDLFLVAYNCLV